MATRFVIDNQAYPRAWRRRTKGRRASDRRLNVETILVGGVILAWAWGIYELTLLLLR
jgi:hypothetical protein